MTPYKTSRGVAIGCAYIKPAARMHHEAERIQALLLRKPRSRRKDQALSVVLATFIGAALAATIFFGGNL